MNSELCGWIVNLTKASKEASSRCCINNSTVSLFSHNIPSSSWARICSSHVDLDNDVPISLFHFLERNITKDSCIINQNINSSKVINCCFDNLFSKFDWIIIRNSNSTFRFNLFYNLIGSVMSNRTSSSDWSSKIIDHNFSSSAGKEECILSSEASSSSSNYCNFAIVSKCHFLKFLIKIGINKKERHRQSIIC